MVVPSSTENYFQTTSTTTTMATLNRDQPARSLQREKVLFCILDPEDPAPTDQPIGLPFVEGMGNHNRSDLVKYGYCLTNV